MTSVKQTQRNTRTLISAYEKYSRELELYSLSRIHSTANNIDLVQDTFIKTWKYLAGGGKIATMRTFLYHVLKGLVIDEYRRQKTVSLDVLLERGFDQSAGNFERFLNISEGKMLFLLISKLPKPYQRVMRLRYINDLSLKQMSHITGKTKSTLAVQAHRGLQKLRSLYMLSIKDTPVLS